MQLQEDKCRPGCMQLKLQKSVCWGFAPVFFILRLSSLGSGASEPFASASASAYPHAPLESVIRESNCAGVRLLFPIPVNFVWPLRFDLDIPTHTREITQWEGKPTCVSREPRFIHTANLSSCLNRLGCCPVYYLSHVVS
jgi:hypothetical protein